MVLGNVHEWVGVSREAEIVLHLLVTETNMVTTPFCHNSFLFCRNPEGLIFVLMAILFV